MQLTETIANQIVQRAMKIIHHSINVMDAHGHIIGSGDPKRIHQKHEGAVLAINENRIVDIDQSTAAQLKGVKPGINLPIFYHQAIIGVVGISGDPKQVRHYAELVKMTAELIVEQAALMDQVQWSKRHREELLLQLINEDHGDSVHLLAIAEKLGLDLSQPRIAAVVQVLPKQDQSLSLEHLQRLVHLLEFPERDNLVGILSVLDNLVVVLKPITLTQDGWSQKTEAQRVKKLISRIDKEGEFSIRIAIGDHFPGLTGFAKSYQSARATLSATKDKSGRVFFFSDHRLPVLVDAIKQDEWRHKMLTAPLNQLLESDKNGVLVKTLQHYFSQNCDQAKTCESLHIHRNTLRYRIDKIEQITSLNINNIEQKTQLYLALSLGA